ncbi:hypothetical protein CHRY9293_03155 [Chryseobacterium potabilaquae]|uniref:Uncharacterized protein n=1 Tax=Chryseobacterium potabilaquae TaxID=2675057 RepID=A0A6N4XBR7_9FLAO|nr:hypothetical protein CHRY9293_03155 [Chryseobacterium potabilaquae]
MNAITLLNPKDFAKLPSVYSSFDRIMILIPISSSFYSEN